MEGIKLEQTQNISLRWDFDFVLLDKKNPDWKMFTAQKQQHS